MTEFWWDAVNRTRMGAYLTRVESEFIDECLDGERRIHRILDVGGGSGRFATPLQRRGYEVTVTEIDPLPLEHVKRSNPDVSGVQTARSVEEWPIRDASIDCVIAIEVYLGILPAFWRECRRVLRPGGVVVTSVLNSFSYKGALYQARRTVKGSSAPTADWARCAEYGTRARHVVDLLGRGGFELTRASGFNWLPVQRASESRMVPLMAGFERWVGLRRLVWQSPWVLLCARRIDSAPRR